MNNQCLFLFVFPGSASFKSIFFTDPNIPGALITGCWLRAAIKCSRIEDGWGLFFLVSVLYSALPCSCILIYYIFSKSILTDSSPILAGMTKPRYLSCALLPDPKLNAPNSQHYLRLPLEDALCRQLPRFRFLGHTL
ncbi:hypothetical protein C8J55DRAFT_293166 [Lentinula edodes]|uniref:Uncharacterized protein n=1 Tax=Lentinula lateritia TaxID=40482 RepID=A0A9W8ZRI7_9AGAR|nr:hypothetical protein C8J55DRAFT_293166 [Lentinula edodes]